MIYTNIVSLKRVKFPEPVEFIDFKQMLVGLKKTEIFYLDTETYAPDIDKDSVISEFIKSKEKEGKKITEAVLKSAQAHYDKLRGSIALNERKNAIRLIQINTGKDSYIIDTKLCDYSKVIKLMNDKYIVGQNLKFDLKTIISKFPDFMPLEVFDTMLGHKIIKTAETAIFFNSKLGDIVWEYMQVRLDKSQGSEDWNQTITPEMFWYSYLDVKYLPEITKTMIDKLNERSLSKNKKPYFDSMLYDQIAIIEMKFLLQLVFTELRGIRVNTKVLKTYMDKLKPVLDEYKKFFDDKKINTQSPLQLLNYLESEGIDVIATDKKTLLKHSANEIVDKLLRVKKLQKEYQMIDSFINEYIESDGRIYPSYAQIRASTGRMSCYDPNMQQIPRTLKSLFYKADTKYSVIKCDYPAIEARTCAIITNDSTIIDMFKHKKDMHKLSAVDFLHKPEEEITKLERLKAKAANFGFMFGMGPKTYLEYAYNNYGLTVTMDEATVTRQKYLSKYRGIKKYHDKNSQMLSQAPSFVTNTILGRRMKVDKFTNANSFPIQGSAADCIKLAAVIFFNKKRAINLDAEIINIVHDELVIECNYKQRKQGMKLLKESMETAVNYMLDEFETEVEIEETEMHNKIKIDDKDFSNYKLLMA